MYHRWGELRSLNSRGPASAFRAVTGGEAQADTERRYQEQGGLSDGLLDGSESDMLVQEFQGETDFPVALLVLCVFFCNNQQIV